MLHGVSGGAALECKGLGVDSLPVRASGEPARLPTGVGALLEPESQAELQLEIRSGEGYLVVAQPIRVIEREASRQ